MIKSGDFLAALQHWMKKWLKYGSDILMTLAMTLIHSTRKLKIMQNFFTVLSQKPIGEKFPA